MAHERKAVTGNNTEGATSAWRPFGASLERDAAVLGGFGRFDPERSGRRDLVQSGEHLVGRLRIDRFKHTPPADRHEEKQRPEHGIELGDQRADGRELP